MEIVFSHHARRRMAERKILDQEVYSVILQPDKVERDHSMLARFVAKKIYQPRGGRNNYLLMVFYEVQKNKTIRIITVISTSKVQKYY